MNWEVDPDLACLREEQAIEKLPTDEQQRYHELWRQVGALRESASQRPTESARMRESRAALVEQRRLEEARVRWQMDLEEDPTESEAWNTYAELCLFLGYDDDYRRGSAGFAGAIRRISRRISC